MPSRNVLCLDVGSVRVGVAVATDGLRVARPIKTLERTSGEFWDQLEGLISEHGIGTVVLGLPRGLDGQETEQTQATRAFHEELLTKLPELRIVLQDEALTSEKARSILEQRGGSYEQSEIDAVAASVILDDYLVEQETTSEKI